MKGSASIINFKELKLKFIYDSYALLLDRCGVKNGISTENLAVLQKIIHV